MSGMMQNPDRILALTVSLTPGIALFLAFLLVPQRWLRVVAALSLLGMLGALLMRQVNPDDHMRIGEAVGTFLLLEIASAAAAGLAVRIAFRIFRRRTTPVESLDRQYRDVGTAVPNAVAASLLMLLVPVWILYAAPFARMPGRILVIILGAAIAALLIIGIVRVGKRIGLPALDPASFVLALYLALLAGFAFHTGQQFQTEVGKLAAGRPYCVLAGATEVESAADATVLNLRAGGLGARASDYSALMIIHDASGNRLYNWSYNLAAFTPANMTYMPARTCTPRSHDENVTKG